MLTNKRARLLLISGFLGSALLLQTLGHPLAAQTRHIELNDLAKIVSVTDPQISPDGKSIVVAVSRPNLEQDRSDRQLILEDIASGAQRILTYERKGVGSPRWSPRELEKLRSPRFSFSPWLAAKRAKSPMRRTASSNLPGGPMVEKSRTLPLMNRKTKRRSRNIRMLLRWATTTFWQPKRRSLRIFG